MAGRELTIDDRIGRVGRFVRSVRAARFYSHGGAIGFLWNWWHPLAWISVPFLFVFCVACVGIPEAWWRRSEIGVRLPRRFDRERERYTNEPADVELS